MVRVANHAEYRTRVGYPAFLFLPLFTNVVEDEFSEIRSPVLGFALRRVQFLKHGCKHGLVDHEHPHLTGDVLRRDAHAFAAGGWWQSSTFRTLSGSR
jgi:hypothetical protein